MFDGERGQVRVVDQVAATFGSEKQTAHDFEVAHSRLQADGQGSFVPFFDNPKRRFHRRRMRANPRVRSQPKKSERHHPRQPDELLAVQHALPPVERGLVPGVLLRVSIDEQIHIWNDQLLAPVKSR